MVEEEEEEEDNVEIYEDNYASRKLMIRQMQVRYHLSFVIFFRAGMI